MFRFKIALGFIIALTLAAAGVYFTYAFLNRMSNTIDKAVKPDDRLIRLKNLVNDIYGAENAVRTFAVHNNNEKYLDPYYNLISTIDDDTDTLKKVFFNNRSDIDEITSLLKEKLASYDELIELRYNSLIEDYTQQLNLQAAEADSQAQAAREQARSQKPGKFLFGLTSKKFYTAKQKELDTLIAMKEAQSVMLKQKVKQLTEKQNARVKEIANRELELLEKDKSINKELLNKINHLEEDVVRENKTNINKTITDLEKQQQMLLYISIAASAFILLLSIIIFADINRSNTYKKQLEISRSRAEQLAKFREEFLSNMSHELRTPVSALSGFSKRLEKTNLNTEQQEFLKNISFASDHLLGVINDVLDIARIESGQLKLSEDNFSVYEIASEVVSLLSTKALEKNIELSADIDSVKNIVVSGDAMRLRQLLLNILGNAIKFTSHGAVSFSIKFSDTLKKEGNKNFEIKIKDTGIGIAADKLKSIFEPFTQADMGIARKFGGTGLGLSISKKIVELHKGTLQAESKEGEGTTFTAMLSYKVVAVAEKKLSEGDKPNEEKKIEKPIKTLIGLKILLAEDDELNNILQQSILNDLGAHVDGVENGEEVLMKLQLEKYDAVLMDLQMPELNGIETTRRIREDLKSAIPVIAVTANVHAAEREKCFAAGMNDVVIKPFSESQIAEVILNHLKQKSNDAIETTQDAASEEETNLQKPYNLSTLEKASNGNSDFVVRMVKLFCMSGESLFNKAKENLAAGNVTKAAENIHRLIPSCRQLDINQLANSLKQLEDDCIENKNSANILNQLNNCYLYFNEVAQMLADEVELLQKTK